ncbi:cytochrome b6-f complex subunit PetL [Alkalinema pantanalense]
MGSVVLYFALLGSAFVVAISLFKVFRGIKLI